MTIYLYLDTLSASFKPSNQRYKLCEAYLLVVCWLQSAKTKHFMDPSVQLASRRFHSLLGEDVEMEPETALAAIILLEN